MLVLGVGPLVGYAWVNKLGDFAKSPQRVEMGVGSSSFVAGGRARLWFASVELGPQVEVTCKGQSRLIELVDDEPSGEVCGIRVKKLDVYEKDLGRYKVLRGVFEVTWEAD